MLFALWLCGLDLPLIIRAICVGRIGMVVIVLTCHTCNLGWNELRTPFWILFSTMDKVLDITDQQDSISSLTGTTPCNVATSHTKFLYYITRKPFCYSACSNFFIQLQALQHVFLELSKFEMREDSTLHHDELRTTSTGVLVYDCETWGLFGKEVIEQNLGQVLEFICHFFSSVKNWLKRVITYVFYKNLCCQSNFWSNQCPLVSENVKADGRFGTCYSFRILQEAKAPMHIIFLNSWVNFKQFSLLWLCWSDGWLPRYSVLKFIFYEKIVFLGVF